jgi:DNA-directed RNA polymerase specialized sigma24 family protein
MLNLHRFRRSGPNDSFTAWLATITQNKIRDHYCRKTRQWEACGGTTAQQLIESQPVSNEKLENGVRPEAKPETRPGRV